ncbi:MAG: O-antigen ligase family protein, partial [Planctomycetes bacterium]|nr:O-antigen ligase family protein [Planctomycetota bacterium]
MIKKIITPILGFFPLLIAVLLPFFSGGEDPLIKLFSILLISFSLLLFTLFSGLKWLRGNSFFSARVILGLFLLFSFLSSIFSHNVFFSLLCWLEFLLGALIFFTLQKQEFWQNKKYSILAVIVSSSTLLSLLGFFYYLVGNYTRLTSTFYWPNPFASFLLLILPLNIYLLWQGRYKLIWLLFLIINGSAFVLTGSRGAWLSLILVLVGLAIIAWRQKEFFVPKKNIFNILKIFILIVILAFVLQGLKDNNWSFIQRNYQGPLDSSSVMRLDYWLGAGKIFISNPFLGTGLGSFKTVYQYYQSNPLSSGKYAHNWYLELLAEGGILVFLSFLAFILLVLRPQNKMTENPFSWFILISLSSYLLHNGVDIGSHYFANQILFWLLLTWYISINIKIEKKENNNLFIPRFIPVIILGLTTIFIVLICFTALI